MYLILVYFLSALIWGSVTYTFIHQFFKCHKLHVKIPPLLLPFTLASTALLVESLYFGVLAYDYFILKKGIYEILVVPDFMIIPKIIIMISGAFILIKMRAND